MLFSSLLQFRRIEFRRRLRTRGSVANPSICLTSRHQIANPWAYFTCRDTFLWCSDSSVFFWIRSIERTCTRMTFWFIINTQCWLSLFVTAWYSLSSFLSKSIVDRASVHTFTESCMHSLNWIIVQIEPFSCIHCHRQVIITRDRARTCPSNSALWCNDSYSFSLLARSWSLWSTSSYCDLRGVALLLTSSWPCVTCFTFEHLIVRCCRIEGRSTWI